MLSYSHSNNSSKVSFSSTAPLNPVNDVAILNNSEAKSQRSNGLFGRFRSSSSPKSSTKLVAVSEEDKAASRAMKEVTALRGGQHPAIRFNF